MFTRKVKLPTTIAEFDDLVARVVTKYRLEDAHHAAAIISMAIRHIPNHEAYTTLEYLGHTVMKNIANHIANHKSESLKHSAQIEHLIGLLNANPNDQQALDELQKAAQDGSESAKIALSKIEEMTSLALAN